MVRFKHYTLGRAITGRTIKKRLTNAYSYRVERFVLILKKGKNRHCSCRRYSFGKRIAKATTFPKGDSKLS
jgi:hypothetical protein